MPVILSVLMRRVVAVAFAVVFVSTACGPARENGRPVGGVPSGPTARHELLQERAPVGASASIDARDAAEHASDAGVAKVGDAGDPTETNDAIILAQGPGACPDWLPSSHASFRAFRSKETAPFPRGGDATCCLITMTDALCRTGVNAEHVVGAMYGTSLVGIRRGSGVPWLDVPLEVRQHGSMKYPGPLLVRLKLTTAGAIVTLALSDGTCPRACSVTSNGCHLAERDAMRSCEALGSYLAGDARKRP
ncbi:MAG TPA: hypothetical protein VLT33_21410 [Labilithrix sp.]|nr:hypothetical protein [Labilithrix sp.]